MKNLRLIFSIALLAMTACASNKKDEPTPVVNIPEKPTVPVTPSGPKITVSTVAGKNASGYVDGNGNSALFNTLIDIAIDKTDNIFVSDWGNYCIRKITPGGQVSTYLGGTSKSIVNGPVALAQFAMPYGMAFNNKGDLFVGEYGTYSVRKVGADGIVSNFASNFNSPIGMATDVAGNLYVASSGNGRIYKVTADGVVTVLAGSGKEGIVDGTGTDAMFKRPCGIALDKDGNLFVVDFGANNIRKITQGGVVTTVAGNDVAGFADGTGQNALFNIPSDLAFDSSGNLYVADSGNKRIRKITTAGVVTTLVGTGVQGYVDGDGALAQFIAPNAISINSAGDLFIIDGGKGLIRKITIAN